MADLDALLDLSESLVNTHDFDETVFRIACRLAEVLQCERCSIVLLGEVESVGVVVATSDDPTAGINQEHIDLSSYPEIEEVVRTRQPLITGSIIVFPVQIDARVQGAMVLRDLGLRSTGLSDREIRFGRIVANATAIAIRNERLYELIRDRSERRLSDQLKAERRLRQIEKYQRFFDFAGDGLMIVEGSGRILFANRAARSILGFDASALTRVTLQDLVEQKERLALDSLLEGMRRGEYQKDVDLTIVTASGEIAVLSLTTAGLDEAALSTDLADPRPSQALGDVAAIISFRDVTATRKMQEELRTTKDFLFNVIESSADAIVAADIMGRILIFNKVAERITGYPSREAVGRGVGMLYAPGVARDIMADLRSSDHGGVGRLSDRRQSLVTRTGEIVPISLAAAIVYDQGREVATVGIFSDLRERLRMEETLQKAQRQLEMSERQAAVVELAGAAAHELNQPLTSILGSADLMVRKLLESNPARATLKTILSESERMAEIVRKLGQITRYETKPYLGDTQILDLDAASEVQDAVSDRVSEIDSKGQK